MTAPTADPAPTPTSAAQGRPELPVEPARQLSPSPGPDRAWRVTLTVLAVIVLMLTVAALATSSVAGWAMNRGFSHVPAATELGSAETLTLTTDIADIRVIHSGQAEEVTMALVPDGSTDLPPEDAEVRARVEVRGEPGSPVVDVRQPRTSGPIPWESDVHDLLVVVPTGHTMGLNLRSNVGSIQAEGGFTSLTAASNVGEILLTAVSAPDGVEITTDLGDVELDLTDPGPGGVEITSSVGEVDMRLPTDSTGDVTITTEVGNVSLEAPGTGRWHVDAVSEVGEVRVDPDLTGADGPITGRLSVQANVGDVTLSR